MTTWAVILHLALTKLFTLLEVTVIVIYVSKHFLKARIHNPKKGGESTEKT